MENWALVAIAIAAFWIVGIIGIRVGYHDGYHDGYRQAVKDRKAYDEDAEADFWPEQEGET